MIAGEPNKNEIKNSNKSNTVNLTRQIAVGRTSFLCKEIRSPMSDFLHVSLVALSQSALVW